jgi:choline dehydrogenase-like flavoprotein
MQATALEIYDAAGMKLTFPVDERPGGFASHEVGTMRMGSDPKTSVVDRSCRAHEVPNLFLCDGSVFTTFPEKNPTLTIVALALRAAELIANSQ